MRRLTLLLPFIALPLLAQGSSHKSTPSYAAIANVIATRETNRLHHQTQEWAIFPSTGSSFTLPLWNFFVLWSGEDGRTVYGRGEGVPGIERVDLLSHEVAVLPGSGALHVYDVFAVSPRLDLVILESTQDTFPNCGLYAIAQPGGQLRTIRKSDPCGRAWASLSISPDDRILLREKESGVETVDIETGALGSLGNYRRASWSPDGKWVAALSGQPSRKGRLVLLDRNFRFVRKLGSNSDVHLNWSPDSRYLLVKSGFTCAEPYISLSALDVLTGKRTKIKSSSPCKIYDNGGYFWVSDEVSKVRRNAEPSQ